MPRREILTPSQRVQLLALPDDEGELIRRYLTKADLAFVRQHRGDHNRLGIAVQMCSLRFPGRVLGDLTARQRTELDQLGVPLSR
jgi:TnpA family transposase